MTIAGTRPVPPVSRTAARQNDSRPRSGNALAILHLQERAFDVKNFSGFCVVSVSGAFVLQLGAMCSVAGDVRGAPKAGRKRCCPHGLEPCQPTLGLSVPAEHPASQPLRPASEPSVPREANAWSPQSPSRCRIKSWRRSRCRSPLQSQRQSQNRSCGQLPWGAHRPVTGLQALLR